MPHKFLALSVAALLLTPNLVRAQQPSVVMPGAPGKASTQLPANMPPAQLREPTKADVDFMQGMIMHHSQAVEMTELLKTRSNNPEV